MEFSQGPSCCEPGARCGYVYLQRVKLSCIASIILGFSWESPACSHHLDAFVLHQVCKVPFHPKHSVIPTGLNDLKALSQPSGFCDSGVCPKAGRGDKSWAPSISPCPLRNPWAVGAEPEQAGAEPGGALAQSLCWAGGSVAAPGFGGGSQTVAS